MANKKIWGNWKIAREDNYKYIWRNFQFYSLIIIIKTCPTKIKDKIIISFEKEYFKNLIYFSSQMKSLIRAVIPDINGKLLSLVIYRICKRNNLGNCRPANLTTIVRSSRNM